MKPAGSIAAALASLAGLAIGMPNAIQSQASSTALESRMDSASSGITPSFDTKSCPGYQVAGAVQQYDHGFTLPLSLGGDACNAYGVDVQHLTLSVVYEKEHQLHVHIYDTDQNQFQLPLDLLMTRPSSDPTAVRNAVTAGESDLEFHHTAEAGYDNSSSSSWAFWISRKNSAAAPIFDTRAEKIPTYDTPFNASAVNTERNTTAMPNHNMIFENQYVQISSVMPTGANVYGLGERYSQGGIGASSWRLDPDGMLQPFFNLDVGDPLASNMYGYHPVYLEARNGDDGLKSHVVAYQNTAGMDIIMRRGVIQYRAIGGTLDFRFMSGDSPSNSSSSSSSSSSSDQGTEIPDTNQRSNWPATAIEQYVQYVNLPIMIPRWALGFQMLRWGYRNVSYLDNVRKSMKASNIPLETQYSDIDYMKQFRDFTIDPNSYGTLADYVNNLTASNQRYIPIIDAAIPATPLNGSDVYNPGASGSEMDIFVKNENGTDYIGIVWPGPAKFMDVHAERAQEWWSQAFHNFSQAVNFSGIWLDMTEPSSFIVGSAVDPNHLNASNTVHVTATSVNGWPEGYCNQTWGNSGNRTVNGQLTYSSNECPSSSQQLRRDEELDNRMPATQEYLARAHARDILLESRQSSSSSSSNNNSNTDFHYSPAVFDYKSVKDRVLHDPPYAIHNGIMSSEAPLVDNLNQKTAAMPSVTKLGPMYDVHNIYGGMIGMRTHNALQSVRPDERPFVVARSTYPGVGKYTSHWLGDNYSKWQYLAKSIEGLLQFQLFGIPTIGADLCGFNGNSDEELCNRWMMQGAFSPLMRQHNTEGAISQEPYVWPSVANATRTAIHKRYELLPEMYSIRARASQQGTPVVRSLWYEFPEQFDTLSTRDTQYMLGPSLLVSPVIEPNVDYVKAFFPAAGGKWRNIFTYEALDVPANTNSSIPAPLSTINVHMRPARILLTHTEAKYTTVETAQMPYSLWVNLNDAGSAKGDAYVDDGLSPLPTPSRELNFKAANGKLSGESRGDFTMSQSLDRIIIMGVNSMPSSLITADGRSLLNSTEFDSSRSLLNISSVDTDLNSNWSISWSG